MYCSGFMVKMLFLQAIITMTTFTFMNLNIVDHARLQINSMNLLALCRFNMVICYGGEVVLNA